MKFDPRSAQEQHALVILHSTEASAGDKRAAAELLKRPELSGDELSLAELLSLGVYHAAEDRIVRGEQVGAYDQLPASERRSIAQANVSALRAALAAAESEVEKLGAAD